mmetsp:Transcript_7847/g.7098  ORF Transcript_7847/g.7098 Transcript_7847/m.7098 type:complete len:206 (+) Transcript_7847:45-662(+)|eukprot:CAMPEP_0114589336 /NCGR_PEP_ID=MMETSP0125-20121206/11801_1 /TAXON_ID=485358 ORGANISM="Aristerostoma sp., Strain ATCC 50986" /NCGR_SAMPLE_ID=MMETSP0125 /ASSEMBLY_ACC=CAM_ASM_000245 /LENGTH=205 /DNA_ID=CAMNT_0001786155 /DNA_START=36 /DNA_END=653 /DNA_ORIENTATION=+
MEKAIESNNVDQVIERLKKYNTIQDEKHCIDIYKEMAHNYDIDLNTAGYPDPVMVAKSVDKLNLGKDIKILDFGCGTGLLGESLSPLGYKNVTGLDASEEMLKKAKEKGSYSWLGQCLLGSNQFPKELIGKFDVAICSGVLLKNHCPKEMLGEMIECLDSKGKGGYCVFSMRLDEYTESYYVPEMNRLESQGKWKKIDEIKFTKF